MDIHEKKEQKRGEVFIWCLVGAALSIVITSFIESAYMRFHGSGWEDVAHVGDFWGGHLNSLALVALALGLLYQKKQLDSHQQQLADARQSLSEQLKAIENDTVQRSVHFLLSQLQAMSQNIEWCATVYAQDGHQERRNVVKGIRFLPDYLAQQKEMPDLISIVVRLSDLIEFIHIVEATQRELIRLPSVSQDVVGLICNVLCPETVRQYGLDSFRAKNAQIEKWNNNPGLRETDKRTLKQLLETDYSIEIVKVGGQYSAIAFNELEQLRYTSGDTTWATEEEALQAMCERIR